MKELIAKQNEDGTFHVVIKSEYNRKGADNVTKIGGTMEIPRAIIEITPLKSIEEAMLTDKFVVS